MEHYLSVVRECMETGVRPRCHLEDITRSDIYGFVIPFLSGIDEADGRVSDPGQDPCL